MNKSSRNFISANKHSFAEPEMPVARTAIAATMIVGETVSSNHGTWAVPDTSIRLLRECMEDDRGR